MSRLMTRQEFVTAMREARIKRETTPSLRLGQSLFNELPADIAEDVLNTDKDMFHVTDDKKAKKMFFDLVDWDEVNALIS